MKETNEYRIIEDMGWYRPQRKHVGYRGRVKWKDDGEMHHGFLGSFWMEEVSESRRDIEKWLGAKIAERKLEAELKKRGPIIVREIKA
jgi:hypothetical protein